MARRLIGSRVTRQDRAGARRIVAVGGAILAAVTLAACGSTDASGAGTSLSSQTPTGTPASSSQQLGAGSTAAETEEANSPSAASVTASTAGSTGVSASGSTASAHSAPLTTDTSQESSGTPTGSSPTGSGSVTTPTGTFAPDESFVWIPAGDHRVPGTLNVPSGSGPLPVVLMLHGDASSRDEVGNMYAREASELAKKGIASLRIDFAGSGASEEPETALSYPNMVHDATASMDFLRLDTRFDPHRIALLGFSRGGTVAATLAGTKKGVAALATWSGAVENGTHEDPQNEAKARKAGHVVVDLGFRTFDYSLDWFTSIAALHALTDVKPYTGPVLAVVGSKDTDVPPSVATNFLKSVASMDTTLHTVKGADHIFGVLGANQSMADDVITTTADWFGAKISY